MGMCCLAPRPADEYRRIHNEPQSYYPSSMSLKASTPAMKGFREAGVTKPYSGNKKILVLTSSQHLLEMANGKYFNTGHHSTETFVPLYHLDKCGFTFDVATGDGKPVAVEEWTWPLAVGYEDKIKSVAAKVKLQFESPKKYEDIDVSLAGYEAVLLPGGHGPLIDMHTYEALGRLLRSAHEKGITTISLCHGPWALTATAAGGDFCYSGYNVCVFPDKVDKQTPMFGYLPGPMKEDKKAEARLKSLGCNIQNKEMDDSTCVDRELITGASQMSAQKLAEAAIKVLSGKCGFEATFGAE